MTSPSDLFWERRFQRSGITGIGLCGYYICYEYNMIQVYEHNYRYIHSIGGMILTSIIWTDIIVSSQQTVRCQRPLVHRMDSIDESNGNINNNNESCCCDQELDSQTV